MSAQQVTDSLYQEIVNKSADFYLVNYANPDMIGHTGNLQAGIETIQFLDQLLPKIIMPILQQSGYVIITADHGNIERMIDPISNQQDKNHTLNLVPFMFIKDPNIFKMRTTRRLIYDPTHYKKSGILADVGISVLKLLNIQPRYNMLGQSII